MTARGYAYHVLNCEVGRWKLVRKDEDCAAVGQKERAMELIPYAEFGQMRMHEFWPNSCPIDTFESYDCLVGYADGDVYGYAYFVRSPQAPEEVVEIRLESLGPDTCPDGAADRLFARLNLPLVAGMSFDDLQSRLGLPIETTRISDGSVGITFICGEAWPYYVECTVWPDRGLQHVMIVRKDFYDRRRAEDAEVDDDV